MKTKVCNKCGIRKSLSKFYKRKWKNKSGNHYGHREQCKYCGNRQRKLHREKYPELTKLYNLKGNLKTLYGITLDDYNKIFQKQNGCCAICGKHQSELNRRLDVDHDHKTGKVRALLCSHCNTGLGSFRDNINVMKKAIKYLEKY